MTDIVERLRSAHTVKSWQEADEQRYEAANEIERLRAERDDYRMAAESEARLGDEARAECVALRADAQRYRWLRDDASGDQWKRIADEYPPNRTDAALDAAMATQTPDSSAAA